MLPATSHVEAILPTLEDKFRARTFRTKNGSLCVEYAPEHLGSVDGCWSAIDRDSPLNTLSPPSSLYI